MAASDWRTAVEVTGPILRLRAFGDDDKRRYYVAVDDGDVAAIRALRVKPAQYAGLEQGQVVTARAHAELALRPLGRSPGETSSRPGPARG